MTDHAGQDLYKALMDVRALHEQVALLLRTADAYLTDKGRGFKPMSGSTAAAEGSASIHHPELWQPHTVFRFYRPPVDAEHVAAFVSVLLCPLAAERQKVDFTEPLVSAGWVRYPGPVADANIYWWSRLATYTQNARDGVAQHHWISEDGTSSRHGNIEQRCFALPLMQVENSSILVGEVLKPLIASLAGKG
jgi:hypothetical protein